MFELPEMVNLARQFNETLPGKTIRKGSLGNTPHKFVWYNRSSEEFEGLTEGKVMGIAHARGKWLFSDLDPEYILVFGECGGRILYHPPGEKLPAKYHLRLEYEDGSHLTATTQMWGAYELYEAGKEQERQYIKDMRPTPIDAEFTFEYFSGLIEELVTAGKRSVKGLLTQDQLIPGLGNAIAQDILFSARLHPRHPISELNLDQKQSLHQAIIDTVSEVIDKCGRNDEVNFYNQPGGYTRIMASKSAGTPCSECGTIIEKIQYLGGSCYFCPKCQT
jgi:formamidopyrimidine-DNA glycosylase